MQQQRGTKQDFFCGRRQSTGDGTRAYIKKYKKFTSLLKNYKLLKIDIYSHCFVIKSKLCYHASFDNQCAQRRQRPWQSTEYSAGGLCLSDISAPATSEG